MKELILLRGLPGSGKSTLGEIIISDPIKHAIISADDFFTTESITGKPEYHFDRTQLQKAHEVCQKLCENLMDKHTERIVVTNTFTKENEMHPYFELAKKYKYRIHTVIVENRHQSQNIHQVPEQTIQKMKKKFNIVL